MHDGWLYQLNFLKISFLIVGSHFLSHFFDSLVILESYEWFAFPFEAIERFNIFLFLSLNDKMAYILKQLLDIDIGVQTMKVLHDPVHLGFRIEGDKFFLLDLLLAVVVSE